MKKIKYILFLAVLVILFLFSPFVFLLNKQTAYYSYKEVVYRTIINNLVGKEKNPEKIIIRLLDYFHFNFFTPPEASVVDKDVYNDLIRGISWCDQRSWALGTFLGKVGIDNRMVMTRNPEGVSNHTILEVYINKKWIFFDPLFGFIIKDENDELVSYEDICRNPSLFYLSPPMLMLKEIEPHKYAVVRDYFARNIFYYNPMKPTIWKNPISKRDFRHRIIKKILESYIYIFGKNFSYFYQDLYLKYFSPPNEGDRMFLQARNYDLFGSYEVAIKMYKNFIDNFPENAAVRNALFFLGILYNKVGDTKSSINTLQILLETYPQTKWKRIARYYLGYDYELLANYELAKEYYLQAIDMYNQLGEESFLPGELKVTRRLYILLNRKTSGKLDSIPDYSFQHLNFIHTDS